MMYWCRHSGGSWKQPAADSSSSFSILITSQRRSTLATASSRAQSEGAISAQPAVGPSIVSAVVRWIREHPFEADRAPVPGASAAERQLLSALGGVAASLLPVDRAPLKLSPALEAWFEAPHMPDDLIKGLKKSRLHPDQLLAELYCALLPQAGRRVLGTFFTPPAVVSEMLDLAAALVVEPPAAVVDPGAGVGAFTGASLKRWLRAEVHAVDVNVVTLGLLAAGAARLTAAAQRRLRLHHADYLQWIRAGRPEPVGPILTIGNPPYTRHQLLSQEQKDAGLAASGALLDNRNSTLAGYIVAATLGRLRPADSTVLLLPANWLHANYASTMREWLWKRSARQVEVRLLQDCSLFPDANITASVLAVGPACGRATRLTLDLGAKKRSVAASRRTGPAPIDWRGYVHGGRDIRGELSSVSLSDIFRVRRGAATGANGFFVVDQELAERLDSDWVVRAAGRLHSLDDEVLDEGAHDRLSKSGAKCWMLRIPLGADTESIAWYIREGKKAGVPERHLASRRPEWWSIEQLPAPGLLLQPMTKHRFRVVVNAVHAFHTNTLYGLYPLGLRAKSVDRVALWLRSDEGQEALRQIARPLSSGLLRVEPRAVGALRLPRSVTNGLAGASTTTPDEVQRSLQGLAGVGASLPHPLIVLERTVVSGCPGFNLVDENVDRGPDLDHTLPNGHVTGPVVVRD